jgi:Cu(I)/Ag(I) efflux system membrane fusion protein
MSTTSSNGRATKTAAFLALLFLIAAIAAGAGYWLGTRRGTADQPNAQNAIRNHDAPATASADAGTAPDGRKILYWHDPMVPGQRFDKPGKSPFMDMDLVPVYADEGSDEGKVSISPRLVQNLGIRTTEVREATLDTGFSAVGAVSVDERNIVAVQSRSPGYVEKLLVRAHSPPRRPSPVRRCSDCACSACPTPRSRASSATASLPRA